MTVSLRPLRDRQTVAPHGAAVSLCRAGMEALGRRRGLPRIYPPGNILGGDFFRRISSAGFFSLSRVFLTVVLRPDFLPDSLACRIFLHKSLTRILPGIVRAVFPTCPPAANFFCKSPVRIPSAGILWPVFPLCPPPPDAFTQKNSARIPPGGIFRRIPVGSLPAGAFYTGSFGSIFPPGFFRVAGFFYRAMQYLCVSCIL